MKDQKIDIDDILSEAFEDHRLSRSESKALRALAKEANPDVRARWRNRAFVFARKRLSDQDAEVVVRWLEDVVRALSPAPSLSSLDAYAYFSPGEHCRNRITQLFRDSQERVDICVFTITDDRLGSAIMDARDRGVKIRIISDDDKSQDRGSDVARFERKGIPVRIDSSPNHMHHKFAVFDQQTLLTGSYNWTRSAVTRNQENIVVIEHAKLVKSFSAEFERLWAQFADHIGSAD